MGDIREIQSVLVHLLAALRLDLGGAEVNGPLEETLERTPKGY